MQSFNYSHTRMQLALFTTNLIMGSYLPIVCAQAYHYSICLCVPIYAFNGFHEIKTELPLQLQKCELC